MNIYFAMVAALLLAFAGGFCAAWLVCKLRPKPETIYHDPEYGRIARAERNAELLEKLNHKRDEHGRFTK